jgi:hypothetical protein
VAADSVNGSSGCTVLVSSREGVVESADPASEGVGVVESTDPASEEVGVGGLAGAWLMITVP